MQIKILLVEDQKLMRIGIKSLFCDYPEMDIIAEAANGKEAIEKSEVLASETPKSISSFENLYLSKIKKRFSRLKYQWIKEYSRKYNNKLFK